MAEEVKLDESVSHTTLVATLTIIIIESFYPYERFLAAARNGDSIDAAFVSHDFRLLAIWLLFAVTFGCTILGLLWKATGRFRSAAAVTFVVLFIGFSGEALADAQHRLSGAVSLEGDVVLATLLFLAVGVVLLASAWMWGRHDQFIPVVLAISSVMALTAIWQYQSAPSASALDPAVAAFSPGDEAMQELPDVYVLVLDGYGSQRALRQYGGVDITDFVGRLERNGFTVEGDARSAYSATVFSVASALNLEQTLREGEFSAAERVAAQSALGGNAVLFKTLQAFGYRTVILENRWNIISCDSKAHECRSAGSLNDLGWAFIHSTLPSVVADWVSPTHPWPTGSAKQLESLIEITQEDSSSPKLVFAHVLSPHPPFQLDGECTPRNVDNLNGFEFFREGVDDLVRREALAAQLQCINGRVSEFIELLDDSAIVAIFGDHGSDFRRQTIKPPAEWNALDIDERFSILLAARMPVNCRNRSLGPDPINLLRTLVACVAGTELEVADVEPQILKYSSDGSGIAVALKTESAITERGVMGRSQ